MHVNTLKISHAVDTVNLKQKSNMPSQTNITESGKNNEAN